MVKEEAGWSKSSQLGGTCRCSRVEVRWHPRTSDRVSSQPGQPVLEAAGDRKLLHIHHQGIPERHETNQEAGHFSGLWFCHSKQHFLDRPTVVRTCSSTFCESCKPWLHCKTSVVVVRQCKAQNVNQTDLDQFIVQVEWSWSLNRAPLTRPLHMIEPWDSVVCGILSTLKFCRLCNLDALGALVPMFCGLWNAHILSTIEPWWSVDYGTFRMCRWTMEPWGSVCWPSLWNPKYLHPLGQPVCRLWNPEGLCLWTMEPKHLWTIEPLGSVSVDCGTWGSMWTMKPWGSVSVDHETLKVCVYQGKLYLWTLEPWGCVNCGAWGSVEYGTQRVCGLWNP